jgi:hypothetical protein
MTGNCIKQQINTIMNPINDDDYGHFYDPEHNEYLYKSIMKPQSLAQSPSIDQLMPIYREIIKKNKVKNTTTFLSCTLLSIVTLYTGAYILRNHL